MTITFIVYGDARPASFSFGRGQSKSGKPFMWKSTKHADWMKSVRAQALEHKPEELIVGAVGIYLIFWRRKPSGAGKDWRNAKSPERAAKAAYPISTPDLTSLERPIEDALSGLFYRDDAQIQEKRSFKFYVEDDERERVEITVEALHPLYAGCRAKDAQRELLGFSHLREFAAEIRDILPQEQEDPWDAAAKAQV